MDLAKTVDIALVGIGGVSCFYPYGYGRNLSSRARRASERGAVGNICGNFYDIEGNQVGSSALIKEGFLLVWKI